MDSSISRRQTRRASIFNIEKLKENTDKQNSNFKGYQQAKLGLPCLKRSRIRLRVPSNKPNQNHVDLVVYNDPIYNSSGGTKILQWKRWNTKNCAAK